MSATISTLIIVVFPLSRIYVSLDSKYEASVESRVVVIFVICDLLTAFSIGDVLVEIFGEYFCCSSAAPLLQVVENFGRLRV